MQVESPRAAGPARRPTPTVLTAPAAHRHARRVGTPSRRRAVAVPIALRNAALAAGSVLTVTGRGDLWTCAICFGVADASALTAVAVLAAAVATLARAGSAGLSDVAGAQAVLGAAGFTGTAAAVGATWASAASLVTVARTRIVGGGLGLVAGALVAGPSLNDGMTSALTALGAAVIGAALGIVLTPGRGRRPWQQFVALGIGAVGVALGIVAGYH